MRAARWISGFSTNDTIRPSVSTSITPSEGASSTGTGMAATVRSASRARWKSIIWRTSIL